jgi:PBP1b-binding outer membrane lipoprotein LpoB
MKKFLILSLCCFLALTLLSCGNGNPAVDELGQAEEVEVAPFTQEDFVLRIDTLPYRGAVLFIDYNGEMGEC